MADKIKTSVLLKKYAGALVGRFIVIELKLSIQSKKSIALCFEASKSPPIKKNLHERCIDAVKG